MHILFIGDIVGKPGRDAVKKLVPILREEESLDLVIANAENAASGSGLTPVQYKELAKGGVDAFTLGDHIYRRKEICDVLNRESNIVRPANLPADAPGKTWSIVLAKDDVPVAFCCFLGQLFMRPMDSPYVSAERVLSEMPSDVVVRFVDFHAEATSEMQVMGRLLDGRVSAVLGTHTHVATADECILPGGTAFQADVGMTGPFDSILGRRIDRVLQTTLTAYPTAFEVASGDVRLTGTIVEIDPHTGKSLSIRRVQRSI